MTRGKQVVDKNEHVNTIKRDQMYLWFISVIGRIYGCSDLAAVYFLALLTAIVYVRGHSSLHHSHTQGKYELIAAGQLPSLLRPDNNQIAQPSFM